MLYHQLQPLVQCIVYFSRIFGGTSHGASWPLAHAFLQKHWQTVTMLRRPFAFASAHWVIKIIA